MTVEWELCDPEERAIVLDVAHWQGTRIDWAACRDLGVEAVIAKAWHGAGALSTDDVQLEGARSTGIVCGRYAWLLEDGIDKQVAAWTAEPTRDDDLPLMIDFEEPAISLRGRPLVALLERAVGLVADKTGRLPIVYTGEWYWHAFAQDVDSPIVAECALAFAAYPRKSASGTRYREGLAEVCNGIAPRIPVPWRTRGLTPAIWQFDGDGGLVLPAAPGVPGMIDVDVNGASRTALRRLVPTHRDTDPGAPFDPRPPAMRIEPIEVVSREQLLDELADTTPGTPTSKSGTMRAVTGGGS